MNDTKKTKLRFLPTIDLWANEQNLMLTIQGQDVQVISRQQAETVVYEVQNFVDDLARQQGKPYGKLVSTRRLELGIAD